MASVDVNVHCAMSTSTNVFMTTLAKCSIFVDTSELHHDTSHIACWQNQQLLLTSGLGHNMQREGMQLHQYEAQIKAGPNGSKFAPENVGSGLRLLRASQPCPCSLRRESSIQHIYLSKCDETLQMIVSDYACSPSVGKDHSQSRVLFRLAHELAMLDLFLACRHRVHLQVGRTLFSPKSSRL